MNKLNLKDVTLFCIDDISPQKAWAVIDSVCQNIEFGDVKLFSSRKEEYVTKIERPINSLRDYSAFIINDAHEYINTEFAMCVQRDGYPVNVGGWTDHFLRFDYIGAPWTWAASYQKGDCPVGRCVGNGGFSIRSKRLMEETAKFNYGSNKRDFDDDEDVFICRRKGVELETKGLRFAPVELASCFSVENGIYERQFGFHGKKTMQINQKLGIFK
tara:strand:+ start:907 stop:1551 length:645 start_codon:yes stop_codon:yes gene_type:complete